MESDAFSPKRPMNDLDANRGDDAEDEVAEMDPEGRYYRYTELVGKGRFKQIFKAFDTQIGIDVAWSKLNAAAHQLSEEELHQVMTEMHQGIDLEHPNIIRCFKCWEDKTQHCINMITELFTSGNLRQFRNQHKHLDLKAVKRMARQILLGLKYLHSMSPPVCHGDLRCDKIYVNGHSGEIKVGDLGLQTLLPKRYETGDQTHTAMTSSEDDVFAFGLCMLELFTLKQLDAQHCHDWPNYLSDIPDEEAQAFVAKCLGAPEARPTAEELLEDPFLQAKRPPPPVEKPAGSDEADSSMPSQGPRRTDDADDGAQPIAIGKLRGEDYLFEFQGKVKEGKMHFRLVMTHAGDDNEQAGQGVCRILDFVFDPDVDTADNLASEIGDEFNLSSTDTEICAAALREWLAKEMPGSENNK